MNRVQHQVLAAEKAAKPAANKRRDDAYHLLQKEAAFNGQAKKWEKMGEESPTFPDEDVKVQATVRGLLADLREPVAAWFDIEATKNATNTAAKADVIVDGTPVLTGVPATTLLFLEQQIAHGLTIFEKIPTLDEAVRWTHDDGAGLWRGAVLRTARPAKIQKPIVLYPATPEHPAQTQIITEDVVIGHWATEKLSGAFSKAEKIAFIARANKLLTAVRDARERANSTTAIEASVGTVVLDLLGW